MIVSLVLFLSSYLLIINNKVSNYYRIFQLLIIATIWWCLSTSNYTMFDDHLKITPLISFYSCLISSLFLISFIPNLQVITILIGLLFLLSSNNLIITFICFELININLYLLICTYSSGIKYIITSLILTTFFIFGIVLTYTNGYLGWPIIIVFLLKLGILPFHQLTADLYDGLPTKIMMILQLPIKLGIFLKIIDFDFNITANLAIASLAIIIPAISTQYAYTFKRFMSLSSTSYQTLLFIMIMFSNFAVANYSIIYIITLGLIMISYRQPIILTLLFLSVAGLPPFIGFYYKLYLVNDLLELGNFWLLFIFLISSLILTANYLERSSFVLLPNFESIVPSSLKSLGIGILLFWSCFGL